MKRAMSVLNGAAIPTTATPAPSVTDQTGDWNPQVVQVGGQPCSKHDWLVILALILVVIFFERKA